MSEKISIAFRPPRNVPQKVRHHLPADLMTQDVLAPFRCHQISAANAGK
ncbi:hypothetical protein RQN30_12365 [Arcanobacterium hippocoleae]